jgi:LmbE family N-acetylglucosaminyl deacetylase
MALDRQNEAGYHAVIQAVGEDPNRWGIVAFDRVSVVFELSEDEIRQKVMAINCHESQIQEWRVLLRNEGDLQRRVYGRESYIRLPAREKEQILRTGAFPEFRQPTPPVV